MIRGWALLIGMVAMLLSSASAQSDWTMVNRDRERDSWAGDETHLHPPFQYVTTLHVAAGGQIAVTGRTVYISSLSNTPNTFYAWREVGDSQVWSFGVPNTGGGCNFTPAVAGSLVFVGGQQGAGLYALDRATGAQRWFKPVGGLYDRSPVLDEDRVYVIGDSLVCLRMVDGATIWSNPLRWQGSVALDEQRLFMLAGENLLMLDKRSGAPLASWYNDADEALAVSGSRVYTNSHDTIVARNWSTGAVDWRFAVPDGEITAASNAVSVSDRTVIISQSTNAQGRGALLALEKATGILRWQASLDSSWCMPATIANGTVYASNWGSGTLYAFDEQSGTLLLEDKTIVCSEQPIVAGGALYVPARDMVRIYRNTPVAVEPAPSNPGKDLRILSLSPQPATDHAVLRFRAFTAEPVRIAVYDLLGRERTGAFHACVAPGDNTHALSLDGLPAGVYIVRINGATSSASARLLIR